MKTIFIAAASLVMSAFVAAFEPNEYFWMRDEFGAGQIPDDPEMTFKLFAVLALHLVIQAAAFALLYRAGRKPAAFGLAAVAVAAAAMLASRA